ncbi:MAG: site-specific integrase [Pseudomonadota bacterium]
MKKNRAENLRIKRKYLVWLAEAKGQAKGSVDKAAAAIDRFSNWLGDRSFKGFNPDWARGFKRHLEAPGDHGKALSAASVDHTSRALRSFHLWLADQPGYKSRIRHSDAEYFSPSQRTANSARGTYWREHPSIEQWRHVLNTMPSDTVIERRNRAVFAFLGLTGSRDGAAASLSLGNTDLRAGCVHFRGPGVETKFGKVFTTWFLPVGGGAREIFDAWVAELRDVHLFGPHDPLFPKTLVGLGNDRRLGPQGLAREPWSSGVRICTIWRSAFESAGLPAYPAHSVRHMLAELGSRVCRSPEQLKAFSQNLGHEDVMTTLRSYGTVPAGRQGEIIRSLDVDQS